LRADLWALAVTILDCLVWQPRDAFEDWEVPTAPPSFVSWLRYEEEGGMLKAMVAALGVPKATPQPASVSTVLASLGANTSAAQLAELRIGRCGSPEEHRCRYVAHALGLRGPAQQEETTALIEMVLAYLLRLEPSERHPATSLLALLSPSVRRSRSRSAPHSRPS
jgi:hypothetical protein